MEALRVLKYKTNKQTNHRHKTLNSKKKNLFNNDQQRYRMKSAAIESIIMPTDNRRG
jgi:hypothetical protein